MEAPAVPIDVVLPCLNEAAAPPRLLARMPAGYRPIVAGNGSAGVLAECGTPDQPAPGQAASRQAAIGGVAHELV